MTFFQTLMDETAVERASFTRIPVIVEACNHGVSRAMYLDYLAEAYYHVRQTCPLLALAASCCGPFDSVLRQALAEYIEEEQGHEQWILEDISALGGNAATVRNGAPGLPCRLMVAFVRDAIRESSPYAMLGMVHVLEGMSALLARNAATAIAQSVGVGPGGGGFSYLISHGELDLDHVAFFQRLADGIDDEGHQTVIIDTAKVVYRLYGDIFRDVAAHHTGDQHAA